MQAKGKVKNEPDFYSGFSVPGASGKNLLNIGHESV